MSSPNIYPVGIGGSSGDALITVAPIYMTGQIWHVSSATGSDAVSPRGLDRNTPLATLAQAVTNASAGDVIVFHENHAQTLTSQQAISKRLILISEGTGTARARFTNGIGSVTQMWDISAPCLLGNIYFPASTGTAGSNRIRIGSGAAGTVMRGCYFEAGALDNSGALLLNTNANNVHVTDTTFAVTAAGGTSQCGLSIGGAVSTLVLDQVVFDASTYGWGFSYGLDLSGGAVTNLIATNISFLNGSDATIATGSSGLLHAGSTSGTPKIVWAA